MNTFLSNLERKTNYTKTENGGLTHKSTNNRLLDLFALGGSYRNRSDKDCQKLFSEAYFETPLYAVRCLFYLRDCRGGQGERRFFRVCFRWLVQHCPEDAKQLLQFIPEYGRWDDLIAVTYETPLEDNAIQMMYHQLALDVSCKTPSLLAKWLPSENAHNSTTIKYAKITRKKFSMTAKEYRKTLSELRKRINIVERLMSENRWDEIEFDKIPSRAGLIYKNAFARKEIIAEKYRKYQESVARGEKKINADTLTPFEIVREILVTGKDDIALDNLWKNLPDYYKDKKETGLCIIDVSGSMYGSYKNSPLYAAIGMGLYIAERGKGPFKNHFITFSQEPQLVKINDGTIGQKAFQVQKANWGWNTNLEAVFQLIIDTIQTTAVDPKDIPSRLYIFSDMEFDAALNFGAVSRFGRRNNPNTLIEQIKQHWEEVLPSEYHFPDIIFWNLDARQNNIPAIGAKEYSYVSGFNPSMIEQVLGGETGIDLVYKTLNSDRYKQINFVYTY